MVELDTILKITLTYFSILKLVEWYMKFLIWKLLYLFIGTTKVYNKYTLKHNIFLNQNWTLSANIEKIKGKKDYTNYEFSLKYLF
jgi:ABC-type uncharacterized transport system permease subunit